jgi:uncharacterized protein with PIN domain
MDHHVPVAITAALRACGFDVLTAAEDQASELDDESLLARAFALRRILVTQDQGFLSRVAAWRQRGQSFFGLISIGQLRQPYTEIIEWLSLATSVLNEDEIRDRVIFLPMK